MKPKTTSYPWDYLSPTSFDGLEDKFVQSVDCSAKSCVTQIRKKGRKGN